ncbi:hypothetical protein SARC_05159 [Sphaeroforma arctica JP610]|uniref:Uncharacterized protein n=1 Tax=Sphaeroforma arctica JP610 TaxID=667725 RepID=A0A0L0G328_9EUKA|nr:hypothetical protein SARC_05159 [Sphaeroforma arctica JP610]KNC82563.1 hypothetical protein SARC_05159 [Sphaeroforma arctica JP610]|eukprot:XP_014156465.1 hypothetical protein SARC_05159 [Sphaeroforma arctica JP610]
MGSTTDGTVDEKSSVLYSERFHVEPRNTLVMKLRAELSRVTTLDGQVVKVDRCRHGRTPLGHAHGTPSRIIGEIESTLMLDSRALATVEGQCVLRAATRVASRKYDGTVLVSAK